MTASQKIIPIECKAMNYAWGKIGSKSLVFQYLKENENNIILNKNLPYAEFWMGDHPNAPSKTKDGKRISEVLQNSKEKKLPFLFKILSVQKPLSLQCHPDLANAIILHKKDPIHYPDPNHKPECGFFLTKASLLYGIRQYDEIVEYFNKIPEFRNLVSAKALNKFISNRSEDSFKDILYEILTFDKMKLPQILTAFKYNYHKGSYQFIDKNTAHGIDLIIESFPDDVGVFIPFILNVVVAEPGQALVMTTGTLHAYLEGDLIEAMALSDNVIRAAMTPKFVDVETLFHVMNFKPQKPKYLIPKKEIDGTNTYLNYYSTGYDSFNLESGRVESGKSITIHSKKNASIMTILKGKIKLNGTEYHEGNTVLIMEQTEIKIENACKQNAEFYICSSQ